MGSALFICLLCTLIRSCRSIYERLIFSESLKDRVCILHTDLFLSTVQYEILLQMHWLNNDCYKQVLQLAVNIRPKPVDHLPQVDLQN